MYFVLPTSALPILAVLGLAVDMRGLRGVLVERGWVMEMAVCVVGVCESVQGCVTFGNAEVKVELMSSFNIT